MITVIRSEIARLSRPAIVVGFSGALCGISVLATVLTVATASARAGAVSGPTVGLATSLRQLAGPAGMSRGFGVGASLFGLLVFLAFAAATAGDYSLGTIRVMLTREPRRLRLIAGRFVAGTAALLLAEAVAAAAATITAFIVASGRGLPTGTWTTLDGFGRLGVGYADAAIVTVCYAALGTALGTLTRSTVVALAIGIGWLMPIEHIAAIGWAGAGRWLPGLVIDAVAVGGNPAASFSRAVLLGGSYAAVAAVVTVGVFARRDVTA